MQTGVAISYYTYVATPIGKILLVSYCGKSLSGIYTAGQKNLPIVGANWKYTDAIPLFTLTKKQLVAYIVAKSNCFTIDYNVNGSCFQKKYGKA
ncbi:hypothetical protein [Candidatus Cardinium hertigii]|uniref:Uncharacterized protein n=1 Tax=Candidatus Cardinium hertigii TaxID=247481 RepID=A0A2Z3LJQ1_9BACT|nr:hypothetical protein [Candidatus Cardinium hertigii]AWN82270.1 hypothetical protein DK880_00973 [Candidatus Cardinium hertigii]